MILTDSFHVQPRYRDETPTALTGALAVFRSAANTAIGENYAQH